MKQTLPRNPKSLFLIAMLFPPLFKYRFYQNRYFTARLRSTNGDESGRILMNSLLIAGDIAAYHIFSPNGRIYYILTQPEGHGVYRMPGRQPIYNTIRFFCLRASAAK